MELSAETSGALLLVMFVCTIAAGYVFGLLDRKLSKRYRLIVISIVISGGSLLILATLGDVSAPVAVGLLLVMIFAQQFYVPLGAHMRQIIPDGLMGRASTLTALSGVAGIPLMQTAFGVVLDLAEKAGVSLADQYRFGFAMMGLMILLAGAVYATSKHANPQEPDPAAN